MKKYFWGLSILFILCISVFYNKAEVNAHYNIFGELKKPFAHPYE